MTAAPVFEAVSYDVPKSRSFHQATTGPRDVAVARIRQMLADFACDTDFRMGIELTVEGASQWLDAAVAQACLDEARARFGPEEDESALVKRWQIAPDRLDDAIAFALSDARWPRQQSGPIRLLFAYHFNWRELPQQAPDPLGHRHYGSCRLMLNFSQRRLHVAPHFVFPVPYESAAFPDFIARLGAALPFEIKPQYFRRMLVNPKNGATRFLRLP